MPQLKPKLSHLQQERKKSYMNSSKESLVVKGDDSYHMASINSLKQEKIHGYDSRNIEINDSPPQLWKRKPSNINIISKFKANP